MRVSKKQMAEHLGVSVSTIDRKVKRGELTPVFGEKTSFGKPTVSFEIAEPAEPSSTRPEPSDPNLGSHPESEPSANLAERPQSNIDAKLEDDFHFAHRYLQGQATDSQGNRIDGSNVRYSEPVTLLGPEPQIEYTPPSSTTEHMNPALVGGTPLPGVAHAGDLSHPLLKDFKGIERAVRPRHPNQTRQEFLHAMLRDVSQGWSR